MSASFIWLLILQIGLILIVALLLYVYLKQSNSISLESRFSNYSLTSTKDEEVPFFERIYQYIWKLIKRLSSLISKSEVLKNYGKSFEKYISYEEKDKKSGLDYISIKFLISFILGIIYVISSMLRFNFNYMFLILIMFISFFIIDIYFSLEYKNRRKRIENDLLSAIIIMNNSFKSCMNIMQAVSIVESELEGPIKDEFKKISMDIKYGLSLETVFDRFYNRVKIEDAKYITSSLSLINKTGCNIVRVFGAIEKNFYDKKKIKDEMDSLTSSSIFMFRLLITMPILLCLVIFMLNREFFIPLFTTGLGRIIILLILLLYSLYILVVKRVMKVDV